MLNKAQAETIELLYSSGYGSHENPDDSLTFTPDEAFPDGDLKSSGARRLILALASKGIIETIQRGAETRYRCTTATYRAWQEWARKAGEL